MKNKRYSVYIDYSEIVDVEAKSKEEAVEKVMKDYEENNVLIRLCNEAEFHAEEQGENNDWQDK